MFIFLSKFAPLLVYPLGLGCLLLLAALLFYRKRRFSFWLIFVSFVILFAASNRYVAFPLAHALEWKHIPTQEPPASDVIIVLGGATEPQTAPRPTVELNGAADRLFYGAQLYHEGKSSRVLLSGGDIDFLSMGDQTPADDMSQVMQMLGVPQDALILQGKSRNTYEDALYSCQLMKENHLESAILVTSATHMERAARLFAKQGCAVTPAPADFTVTETSWERLWHPNFEELMINLIPSYSNLGLTTKILKEYFGIWVYSLRGWL